MTTEAIIAFFGLVVAGQIWRAALTDTTPYWSPLRAWDIDPCITKPERKERT